MKSYDFENREYYGSHPEKNMKTPIIDTSQAQDTWGCHENYPEDEHTVNAYKPY